MALLQDEFVPLYNFQPSGGMNFRNTCFIAVVANLRHLLEPIRNKLRNFTWSEFVQHVRTLRNDKGDLKFGASDAGGQHDAADLLGDLLYGAQSFGIRYRVTKSMYCCNFEDPHIEPQPVLALDLPEQTREYSLQELLDIWQSQIVPNAASMNP